MIVLLESTGLVREFSGNGGMMIVGGKENCLSKSCHACFSTAKKGERGMIGTLHLHGKTSMNPFL